MGSMGKPDQVDRPDSGRTDRRGQRTLLHPRTKPGKAGLHRNRAGDSNHLRRREVLVKKKKDMFKIYVVGMLALNVFLQLGRIKGWWH